MDKLKPLLPILMAVVFALLAVNSFATVVSQITPFSAELSLELGLEEPGLTRIMLPPIGSIQANTHRGPVSLGAKLNTVDLSALETFLDQPDPQKALYQDITAQSQSILRELALRALLLGMLGGAIGYLFAGPRRLKSLLFGSVLGLMIVALLLSTSFWGYDLAAFENPKFTGAMEYAPGMISFVERSLAGVAEWGERLGQIAENMQSLGQRAQAASALTKEPPSDLVVLHVSDIHNNPAGYEMIKGIVNQFSVDLIIDTGDTSDFGSKVESELTQAIARLGVDYLWVAGNHDAPAIIKVMKGLPNVKVVDGIQEIKGLKVVGLPDPASRSNDVHSSPEELKEYTEQLRSLISQELPEVVMVHNNQVAQELLGLVPVILTGHNHQASWVQQDGTILVNSGSTGAEGLRGLEKINGSPYTAMLLYFQTQGDELGLRYLDFLEFSSDGSGFSLDRHALKGNVTSLKNSTGDDR